MFRIVVAKSFWELWDNLVLVFLANLAFFCVAFGVYFLAVELAAIGPGPGVIGLVFWAVLVSLFLGFCKRRNELVVLDTGANEHRSVLGEYSPVFLDQMISVASGLTIMSYALYTVSSETVRKFETRNLIYTIPFVIYFVFRYFYLVYKKELGGSPTMIMLEDKPIIIDILLWVVSCSLILYL